MVGNIMKVWQKKKFISCFFHFPDKAFIGPQFTEYWALVVIFSSLFFLLTGIRWHMGTELVVKDNFATKGLHPCLPSARSSSKYVVNGERGASCGLQRALPHHCLKWNEQNTKFTPLLKCDEATKNSETGWQHFLYYIALFCTMCEKPTKKETEQLRLLAGQAASWRAEY